MNAPLSPEYNGEDPFAGCMRGFVELNAKIEHVLQERAECLAVLYVLVDRHDAACSTEEQDTYDRAVAVIARCEGRAR